MKTKQIKTLLILAKILITIAFVWAIYRSVDNFGDLFSSVTAPLVISAILFSAIMQIIHIHRWQLALKLEGTRFTFRQCTKSYFVGALLGVISPGRIGEILRFYFLPGLPKKRALYALFIDRIFLMASLAIVGALAVLSYGSNFITLEIPSFFTASHLKSVMLAVALVGIIAMLGGKIALHHTLNDTVKNHHYSLLVFESLFVNVVLLFQGAVLFVLLNGWGVFSGARVIATSYASMQLAPITIANLGTREFFLTLFSTLEETVQGSSVESSAAPLVVAMIVVVVNLLLPAVPGVLLLLMDKIKGHFPTT